MVGTAITLAAVAPARFRERTVPQLINLERSFAREGIVTVNVGTPKLFNYQVSAQDGEAVVQAFQLLEHLPGVNPQHIGIISFSVGDLLACAGAADPRAQHPALRVVALEVPDHESAAVEERERCA